MSISNEAKASLTVAVTRFLQALGQYQAATANINQAALRMSGQNLSLCRDVDAVVRTAASFKCSRR